MAFINRFNAVKLAALLLFNQDKYIWFTATGDWTNTTIYKILYVQRIGAIPSHITTKLTYTHAFELVLWTPQHAVHPDLNNQTLIQYLTDNFSFTLTVVKPVNFYCKIQWQKTHTGAWSPLATLVKGLKRPINRRQECQLSGCVFKLDPPGL